MSAQFSGGKLPDTFRRGWGLALTFRRNVGHYWTRMDATPVVQSDCGLVSHVRLLWGVGNWAVCRKCLKRHPQINNTKTFIEAAA